MLVLQIYNSVSLLITLPVFVLKIATELRDAIHQETGLTCSAGVAPNRMIAKVRTRNFLFIA